MVTISEAAIGKIKEALARENETLPDGGLRVFAQAGGCSGIQFGIVLDLAEPDDEVIDCQGLKVLVDPRSAPLVAGTEVDYLDDGNGGGFTVRNPNLSAGCACSQKGSCNG